MKKILPILLLFTGHALYSQQTGKLSPAAALLFKDVKTTLTVNEQNQVATKVGFLASGDKTQPFIQDKDSKDYPFAASVYSTDMNKDGIEEIFIVFGNTYTSGNTGSSVVLFIKNAAGAYTDNLGFPGVAPDVLATVNKGYPDLLIGGPGFEYPVWRWNGKNYNLYKNVKDADYDKLKKVSLENIAKGKQ
jgi:hypothetical protein